MSTHSQHLLQHILPRHGAVIKRLNGWRGRRYKMQYSSKIIISLLTISIISVSGCGTITTLKLANNPKEKKLIYRDYHYECDDKPSEFISIPYVYSGIKQDLLYLTWPYYCDWAHGEVGLINNAFYLLSTPFVAVDLVLSFFADTVMLPYTIPKQYKEGNIVDPPYFVLGRHYLRFGAESEAIKYYEKGLEVLPKYYGVNNYQEAHTYLFDLDSVFYELANLYAQKSQYEKAVYFYEKIIELNIEQQVHPSIIERYYRDLSEIYSKAGNHIKASECYQKSQEYREKVNDKFK